MSQPKDNTKSFFSEIKDKKKPKECSICCSKRTYHIDCPFCNNGACNECQEKFILSTPNPKCMMCNKEWNYEFLRNQFSKAFMNMKYKKYKENLLLDIEKSLMPSTQTAIENRNIITKRYEELTKQVNDLEDTLTTLRGITNRLTNLLRNEDFNGMAVYLNSDQKVQESNNVDEKKERKMFIKPCPKDGCRGFLSTQYKCGLCDTKCCPDCHDIISKEEIESNKKRESEIKSLSITKEEKDTLLKEIKHKCNPTTLETVKMLQKECRNCPKCGTFIYKISGCNMMFCTNCKTAFDWKTGEIETKNIHNPHYFEYLRQTGQEDNEIRRRFGDGERVERIINNMDCLAYEDVYDSLINSNYNSIFRIINHIERVEIPYYQRTQNVQDRNLDLRIQYLENLIDEDKLKIQIQRRFKKCQFDFEMIQILQMFVTVLKESFMTFFRNQPSDVKTKMLTTFANRYDRRNWNKFRYPDNTVLFNQLNQLQSYVSENIIKICDKYSYKPPNLEILNQNTWDFLIKMNTLYVH